MTFEEMVQKIDELTLDEQLHLMELLVPSIRKKLKDTEIENKHINGNSQLNQS